MEGISREAVDALALVSQQRADRAIKEGRFDKSLVPVLNPDGSVALDHEAFPRPETTAEGLAALKPSFAAIADFDLGDGVTFRKQRSEERRVGNRSVGRCRTRGSTYN